MVLIVEMGSSLLSFQMVEESALQLGNLDLTSEDFFLDEVDGECVLVWHVERSEELLEVEDHWMPTETIRLIREGR